MKPAKKLNEASGATRLWAIIARDARRAVVFRRGPSSQVLVLSWDLETDELTPGQWLKGRIYEDRCDLSPSGDLLVVFAAKYRKPYWAWTAVSRAPWLTALALWPQNDTWGGGGRFVSDSHLVLHTRAELAPGFDVPRTFKVSHAVRGRREASGWVQVREGTQVVGSGSEEFRHGLRPTSVWERPRPGKRRPAHTLQARLLGAGPRNGPFYVWEYAVLPARAREIPLGRLDWADWDHDGSLLLAEGGRLFRLRLGRGTTPLRDLARLKEVADLRKMTFVERTAPAEATRW